MCMSTASLLTTKIPLHTINLFDTMMGAWTREEFTPFIYVCTPTAYTAPSPHAYTIIVQRTL